MRACAHVQDPEACVERAADVMEAAWGSPSGQAPTAANLRQANAEVSVRASMCVVCFVCEGCV